METVKLKYVKVFMVFGFLLLSLGGYSQKLTRQEKKEIKETEMNRNFYILDSLLNAKSFVLEANFLQDKYGARVPVNPRLNFLIIDRTEGVIQTGSDTRIGYNNVGGVTAEGRIGLWKVHKDVKNKNYSVSFNILTQIGNFDVHLTVNADNIAQATITGITSHRLTWHGYLNTVDNSRVFKGMESI